MGIIHALNYVGQMNPGIGTGWHPGLWSPATGLYLEPVTGTGYLDPR
jgi:hypothetical protein